MSERLRPREGGAFAVRGLWVGGIPVSGSMRRTWARFGLLLVVGMGCMAVLPASSVAATTIGQTTDTPSSCPAPSKTLVRYQHTTGIGSPSYAVPVGGGVITSWTTNPGSNTGVSSRLEVIREGAGGTPHTVVGESALQANIPAHNAAAFPTFIPVQAGDRIGLEIESPGGGFCFGPGPLGGDSTIQSTDPGPGNELPQTLQQASFLVDVEATISQLGPPGTCGNTSVGKSSDSFVSNRKRVNVCTLPVNATVSDLTVYLAPTSHSGSQPLKGILYGDSKGKPGALRGTTSKLTFTSKSPAGWYHLAFETPLKLTAGNYWIGVITGASTQVAGERYDSVTNAEAWNTNTYTSGPSDPFGPFSKSNEQMSLYASYTAEQQPCSPTRLSPCG
jgi:hypothetical protein